MIRICRALIVLQVATHANRSHQVVVPILVAIGTLQFGVCACKWESTLRVVKRRGLPRRRAVAHGTVCGESCRDVVRVRRPLIILNVTARACRARKIEIAIQVAVGALQLGVCASKRKSDCGVIERRRLPSCRVVAVLAGLRKSKRNVIRIGGFSEIG